MRILMVCLGNICRSPMAEGIMRAKLEKHGLHDITVDSAGTSDYHTGENPDPRATKKARSYKVDISNLKARQFTVQDFDDFDSIYAMDSSNFSDITALARNEKDKEKVKLILNVTNEGKNLSVPDPYFGGDEGFENVFLMLDKACETIAQDIKSSVK